jgi:hypothetical protein
MLTYVACLSVAFDYGSRVCCLFYTRLQTNLMYWWRQFWSAELVVAQARPGPTYGRSAGIPVPLSRGCIPVPQPGQIWQVVI